MEGDGNKVKLLVVEDEFLVGQNIVNSLIIGGYDVIGPVDNANEALELISTHNNFDLILIDIILKGALDGIELARRINDSYQLPFIFLTSHTDKYLIERAKSVLPFAYILKPFNDRQVSISIQCALVNKAYNKRVESMQSQGVINPPEEEALIINNCLFLKKSQHFERVLFKELLYLEAENNYTIIHTKTGRYVYSMVMKKIEALLPENIFMRIHRSFVINVGCVTGFSGNLLFIDDHKIPVSKSQKDQLFSRFRKI